MDTSLSEVFDLLAEKEAFIIERDGKPIGLINRSDVFRFLSQEG